MHIDSIPEDSILKDEAALEAIYGKVNPNWFTVLYKLYIPDTEHVHIP